MSAFGKTLRVIGLAGLVSGILTAGIAAADRDAPSETAVRRLSPEQYRAIVRDVFSPAIELGGRFEPEFRLNGLTAVGASRVGVTPAGMEQYDAIARSVATQVVSEKFRGQLIPCRPAVATAPDDACARAFLSKVGRLLYRRPMPATHLDAYVAAAHTAAATVNSFYDGLAVSLAAILASPQFLFRDATAERDPQNPGGYRLDAYAKASQLSFFLWNAGPDLPLLTAAAKGELETPKGLARQVDRMIASPRLEDGIRAFFIDDFAFDDGITITKDETLFPKFNAQVMANAREQTLKTLVDLLLTENGDYRDIFTTKKTFLTRELGAIYRVPVVDNEPNGSPDTWQRFEFTADDPRGGILTQIAFTAPHSPAGRGSATLRGKAIREIMLCQKVPAPPGDVKFDLVNDIGNPLYRTARKRLSAHATNPVCGGCHKIMDPVGLALENFDGAGEFRTAENGEKIDASGALNGHAFDGPTGLGQAMHDDPAVPKCLADRLTAYALGRTPGTGEEAWLTAMEKSFGDHGYRVPDLMREIALSDAFYRTAAPPAREEAMR